MNILKLLLLASVLLTGVATDSQEATEPVVKVVASVDRSQVQIADPFKLTIRATAPRETTISFPEFDKQIGAFDILETGQITKLADEQGANGEQWTQTFVLESIDSGEIEIPNIEVSVTDREGSKILRTDPVKVSVISVVETNADLSMFNDIAGLIDVEEPQQPSSNFLWIVSAAGLVIAIAVICLWVATRPAALETSTVWALGNLERAGGDFAQVESILRGFLEEKIELPAASLTAESLINELERRCVDTKQITNVREILSVSERVKFGGLELSEQRSARLNQSARAVIEQLGAIDLATTDAQEVA